MTLPANVRVNASAPFPSLVKAIGPITIARSNGIWTVGMSFANLGLQTPAPASFATDYLMFYDSLQGAFFKTTLAWFVQLTSAITPTAVTSAMSPYAVKASDTILFVDTAGGPIEIDLSPAANRSGSPISIKDVTGHAAVNNITIKPSGAETLDGYTNLAPLVLNANYGGVRLYPNNASYVIAP